MTLSNFLSKIPVVIPHRKAQVYIEYNIPRDGLVGWWRFDEGEGETVHDYSGNGNNGTALGGMSWIAGKYNGAGSFDGVDDYVNLGKKASLQNIESVSIVATIKPNTAAMTGCIATNDYTFGYDLALVSGKLKGYIHNTDVLVGNIVIPLDETLVVYTFDNVTDKQRLYVNGVLDKENTTSGEISTTVNDMYIGRRALTGLYFNGSIDNVMIYNRALSEAEIKQIYYETQWKRGL